MVAPGDRVTIEEFEPPRVARLLAVVDQRHPLADERQRDRGGKRGTEAFELGAFPRILVVILGIGHPHRLDRPRALHFGIISEQRVHVGLAGGDVGHRIVPFPGIGRVERLGVDIALVEFGEHEDGLDRVEFGACRLPEIERHIARDVAAEAVDTDIAHPIFHRLGHVLPQPGLGIVEIDDVGPIPERRRPVGALPVMLVPVGMRGVDDIVPRGMVGDPVEDDVHPLRMRRRDERLEIVDRPELGVHRAIVLDRIGAAEPALAVLLADRMDRHQPQDVDAERLQPRQLRLRSAERSLGGELARVDLIEHRRLGPGGMVQRDIGPRLIARVDRGAARSGRLLG